eukprot:523098-Rhodomonas_salina.1
MVREKKGKRETAEIGPHLKGRRVGGRARRRDTRGRVADWGAIGRRKVGGWERKEGTSGRSMRGGRGVQGRGAGGIGWLSCEEERGAYWSAFGERRDYVGGWD